MQHRYDVIVVGAGHAGCEAAAAAANMGSKTLLVTMDMTKFAQMSCNPAMGGIAKGQIVREIDALGGYSGIVTDKTTVQFRMLNKSKGPAMWSPRAQCDRSLFSSEWRTTLENISNLDFWQDTVTGLVIENNKVAGVKTLLDHTIFSTCVILTNGTFLNGKIHVGRVNFSGGRTGELSSYEITNQLTDHGFVSGRMKTGTPARIDGRSVNFEKLIEQKGEDYIYGFSYLPGTRINREQKSCFIAHTNKNVHDVLRAGFHDSPLFTGTIKGVGPRYCPSIEDKVVTFSDKDNHQLFLEPEGFNTIEYYINGFSSSLPLDVQLDALQKIEGLENIKIFRPGYAIEYDYFDPTQLTASLETKTIKNLFFAGQINGTTGYEEAAAQGLIAGMNAHLSVNENDCFNLNRHEAYIGVLIDDLITKGVTEPYRMFTSRAEYRILLRQDNADFRLTERSNVTGLASDDRLRLMSNKFRARSGIIHYIKTTSVEPGDINAKLEEWGTSQLRQKVKLSTLVVRPQIVLLNMIDALPGLKDFVLEHKVNERREEIIESAEIELKYEGYIVREREIADKLKRLEYIEISLKIDYSKINSLSTEARQKLEKIKPKTIGQASRISGVSPSDINVLLVFLGR